MHLICVYTTIIKYKFVVLIVVILCLLSVTVTMCHQLRLKGYMINNAMNLQRKNICMSRKECYHKKLQNLKNHCKYVRSLCQ